MSEHMSGGPMVVDLKRYWGVRRHSDSVWFVVHADEPETEVFECFDEALAYHLAGLHNGWLRLTALGWVAS